MSRHFAFTAVPANEATMMPFSNDILARKNAAFATIRSDSDVSPISSSNTSTYSSSKPRSAMKAMKSLASRTGSLLDKVAADNQAEQGSARVRISSLAESMAIK